jgi:hypothetical protein
MVSRTNLKIPEEYRSTAPSSQRGIRVTRPAYVVAGVLKMSLNWFSAKLAEEKVATEQTRPVS